MVPAGRFSTEIKVGVFVLLVLLLLGYMSFRLGGFSFFKPREVKQYARFKSASGLAEGGRVLMAGVRVGRISNISLADHQAEVELSLRPGLSLRQDARVSILARGLVGEKYINLEPGSPDSPPLTPGGTITRTASPLGIEATVSKFTSFMEEMRPFLTDVKNAAQGLSQMVGGRQGEPSLKDILANLSRTSQDLQNLLRGLEQGQGTLGKLLKDDGLYKEVQGTVRELKTSVGQLSGFTGRLAKGEGTLGKLATDKNLYQQLQQAVAHLNSVAQKIDQAQGTLGKLVNDKSLYDHTQKAVKNVNQVMEGIKEQTPITVMGTIASTVMR